MRTPTSTYRLQISEQFTLLDAARTLPYLHELGVDWVYLSPILSAEPGSSHGYDVVDHRLVDPLRGGAAGLAALSTEARRLGLGVLVDIVPNHVGIATPAHNPWWWDVLRHGRGSAYAGAFDIDWAAGGDRILVPVVGDDDVLADGRIGNLSVVGGELRYHDHRFPIGPGTLREGATPDAQQVHARQHYRLVGWRDGDSTLNYRRFFTVSTLAGVQVEERRWFDATHLEIGRWFDEGLVDGLRVDHPDGLRDPGGYLADLARRTGGAYVLVEKILQPGEELARGWATAGTTGYDVLGLIDRVLTDPAGERPLTELEASMRGGEVDWHELVHDTKRAVADGSLQAEVRRIVREAEDMLLEVAPPAGTARPARTELEDAVAELLACFGVYRSYLPSGRAHLEQAVTAARDRRPELSAAFDVLAPVLGDGASEPAQRFQQTSGMVMAKGVEDCAFYRWSRLTSLNEVGGDPAVFSIDPAQFHAAMAQRQASWPTAMTATTTHDTKRSEDTRARIGVLAELPDRWAAALRRLLELAPLPDAGFGNLLWQAVVGAWPTGGPAGPGNGDLRQRLHGYAEKAMREAGDRTTWTAPDPAYEAAVHAAVDAALDDPAVRAVLDELVQQLAPPGWSNGLAGKLIALTIPGVPDVYQGTELWDHSLVDPDNRRPVDFAARRDLLNRVATGERPTLTDGAAKLLLTREALRLRREFPERFSGYRPLTAEGPASDHVLAFDRGAAVTVVTRLPVGLTATGWGSTTLPLPPGCWVDLLTQKRWRGEVRVAELIGDHPVALLTTDTATGPGRGHGRFDVWAPRPQTLSLSIGVGSAERVVGMRRGPGDWWHPVEPVPTTGEVDYGYLVDGSDTAVPDPRSRRQPRGVHARSRSYDTSAYRWSDAGWTGRPIAGSVIYELHVGTFTPEGTLDAALGRLEHLRSIGVDLVELMPVNAFNGEHGWGYDGVLWNALHEPYGGPAAYQRFVDAAHAAGIGVIQDVVHNHLGPSGNYLGLFGPYLSTEGRSSWGEHLNLDGAGSAEVRGYIADNVRMWFEEYHVDGLRLDAVHALHDRSQVHLLEELAVLTAEVAAHLRKPLFLIAESDLNDPRLITPREGGGLGVDAQWSDDFHHAVHVALTGESGGYYADFAAGSAGQSAGQSAGLSALAKVCERGFFHDGTMSTFRGREHGRPVDTAHLPAWRLVVCNQNHDQVGNRARGDRLSDPAPGHLDDDQLACAALLTLAGPFTPMLFAGEEWAAATPFAFFTSHPEPELGRAVSEGRVREFARMGWDLATVPDPQDPSTFQRSKLNWSERGSGRHAVLLEVYRSLAELRRRTPELTDPDMRRVSCAYHEAAGWFLMRRGAAGQVVVAVNMGSAPVTIDLGSEHLVVWATPAGATVAGVEVELPPHAGAVLRSLGGDPRIGADS